jgi:hypothetical protein
VHQLCARLHQFRDRKAPRHTNMFNTTITTIILGCNASGYRNFLVPITSYCASAEDVLLRAVHSRIATKQNDSSSSTSNA